jgi:hypothetical protein
VTQDAAIDHPAGPLPAALKVRLWESVLGALPRIILALCGGVALLLVAYQAPVALAVPAGLLVRRAAGRQLGRGGAGDESAGRKS